MYYSHGNKQPSSQRYLKRYVAVDRQPRLVCVSEDKRTRLLRPPLAGLFSPTSWQTRGPEATRLATRHFPKYCVPQRSCTHVLPILALAGGCTFSSNKAEWAVLLQCADSSLSPSTMMMPALSVQYLRACNVVYGSLNHLPPGAQVRPFTLRESPSHPLDRPHTDLAEGCHSASTSFTS